MKFNSTIKESSELFVTNIYNSYYDLTLTDLDSISDLSLTQFYGCKVFGTREGYEEDISYLVNVRMLEINQVDKLDTVRLIGNIELNNEYENDGYGYLKSIEEIEIYFEEEIQIRIEKTKNACKVPALGFMSRNLLPIDAIIMQ